MTSSAARPRAALWLRIVLRALTIAPVKARARLSASHIRAHAHAPTQWTICAHKARRHRASPAFRFRSKICSTSKGKSRAPARACSIQRRLPNATQLSSRASSKRPNFSPPPASAPPDGAGVGAGAGRLSPIWGRGAEAPDSAACAAEAIDGVPGTGGAPAAAADGEDEDGEPPTRSPASEPFSPSARVPAGRERFRPPRDPRRRRLRLALSP